MIETELTQRDLHMRFNSVSNVNSSSNTNNFSNNNQYARLNSRPLSRLLSKPTIASSSRQSNDNNSRNSSSSNRQQNMSSSFSNDVDVYKPMESTVASRLSDHVHRSNSSNPVNHLANLQRQFELFMPEGQQRRSLPSFLLEHNNNYSEFDHDSEID